MTQLHSAITQDLGTALTELTAAGFTVQSSEYDGGDPGNYVAEFVAPHAHYRIIRDRGEYLLDGPRDVLEPHDLWRAYESRAEFFKALHAFIANEKGDI